MAINPLANIDTAYDTIVAKTNLYGTGYHRSITKSILDDTILHSELGITNENEWWAKLLPRIGMTVITPTTDPQDYFGMFSGPEFAFGQYLQRIKVSARQAGQYPMNYVPSDWDGTTHPDPFSIKRPKSWELFGRRNIHKQYQITIHDNEYRAAFTSSQAMGDYVAALIASMRSNYLLDNEITFLKFLRSVIMGSIYDVDDTTTPETNLENIYRHIDDTTTGNLPGKLDAINPHLVTGPVAETTETNNVLDFLRDVQDAVTAASYVQPDYNRWGEYTKYEDPVMIVPSWFATIIRRVTARVYHDQKFALPVPILEIRDFPSQPESYYASPTSTTKLSASDPAWVEGSGSEAVTHNLADRYIYAAILERKAIQWMPTDVQTTEQYNPAGHYRNYFLTVQGSLQYTPWYPELVWTGPRHTT